MNAYLTLIRIDIRLAFRQKVVIFFNYLMPFVFFLIFAQVYNARQGGAILQVVAMVTVLGILGNGLFGAGLRAAQDREMNILRRYKVAPISPLPLLVASTVTGLVVYFPYVLIMLAIAKFRYGMVMPPHMGAVLIFIMLGVMAMRALGSIVASVANSMQESGILVQVLYMAMLFLSGATFPTVMFPSWLLTTVQFIPSTWLMTGMQGLMLRNETLAANWQAVGAMVLTTVLGLLLSAKLFRWEKEEKVRPSAKLWVVAVLTPFVALGAWQTHAKDNVSKMKIMNRDLARSRTVLIRNARIFVGDGRVIENGGVLVKGGKIAEVYDGNVPDPKSVEADPIDAAGKTLLPGLIDVSVHLSQPGGFYDDWKDYTPSKAMQRDLAEYLYSGVTAVRSAGDQLDDAVKIRGLVASGEKQGADLFLLGPSFTAVGGQGAEALRNIPAASRDQVPAALMRLPKSPDEAKQQVDELKKAGVDGIEAVLDSGGGIASRLDLVIFNAIASAARADGLSMIVETGDERDIEDAIRAHVNGIEHGSASRPIPDADFAAMAKQGITWDPALSAAEAAREFAAGKTDLIERPLVQQVSPRALLAGTKNALTSPAYEALRQGMAHSSGNLDIARGNLLRAYRAGVTLVTGSDAGKPLVFHGPTVQHEIALWVEAGVPVQVALQAATLNAARALKAESRIGSIEKGKDATLLLVDGNPLQDIRAIEAISAVIIKGERVNRGERENGELLKQE
ncbi:MAG TPA: amidohydrolase family protein [Bryobacteraceae bacterium]|jgi:imidazolonepropionase-like amidohydrolase/ABC-type multidrug transport system permease subunit|nr:amidohydrolase family protein [Bryobacteraceae bacterium]